ncbi:MAG: glycosyltransferase [Planctomycetes bacterium]|nr:glycosyltransferase [Planctomycetota bacterium]
MVVLKVLLVIPTLDRSGAEKQFSLLATRLPRDQFEVRAVALTRGGPYESVLRDAGIPLDVLNKRFKFDPFALWRLKQILADWKPDILHSWLFSANAYGRLLAGKRETPKVIVSERCVDSWKSGWQLWLDRRQISRTTRLIGNSQGVADFYRQIGFSEEKLIVIPNGVEVPKETPFDRDALLEEFDIPAGAEVIGYAGRLARQKRVQDIVWGMEIMRQLRENVYCLIVGDGPERNRLERFAQKYGCDHLVRFAGHRDDATKLIRAMNVFCLASEFEGMSNSLMEAMAAGVPVVVSDIPPNRELVVDGETGFFVNVGDGVGYAQFADRILADPQLAQRLGSAGRKSMQENFSLNKMVEAHADLYREVMK